jgi:hypothetical protein
MHSLALRAGTDPPLANVTGSGDDAKDHEREECGRKTKTPARQREALSTGVGNPGRVK